MIAFDQATIERRLNKLQRVIDKLEQERPQSPTELARQDTLSDATLYRMQVGIEAVIDIGGHILAEVFKLHPDTYKDIILELGKQGVIPVTLAEENADMVDFRNILVHHYVEIDPEKAFINIEKAPKVLRQFAKSFVTFLEAQDS